VKRQSFAAILHRLIARIWVDADHLRVMSLQQGRGLGSGGVDGAAVELDRQDDASRLGKLGQLIEVPPRAVEKRRVADRRVVLLVAEADDADAVFGEGREEAGRIDGSGIGQVGGRHRYAQAVPLEAGDRRTDGIGR